MSVAPLPELSDGEYFNFEAVKWAWYADVETWAERAVLIAHAVHASADTWRCYPGIALLQRETCMDRKTVISARQWLLAPKRHLLADTGERKGKTGRVMVIQVAPNRPKSGTIQSARKRHHSPEPIVPICPANSPKSDRGNSPESGTRSREVEVHNEVNRRCTREPCKTPATPKDRALSMAVGLQGKGLKAMGNDPHLLQLARDGFTREDLLRALDRLRDAADIEVVSLAMVVEAVRA